MVGRKGIVRFIKTRKRSHYDGKSIFLEPKLQLKLDGSIECKTIIGQKLNKENCFVFK